MPQDELSAADQTDAQTIDTEMDAQQTITTDDPSELNPHETGSADTATAESSAETQMDGSSVEAAVQPEPIQDDDLDAAKAAWEDDAPSTDAVISDEALRQAAELAEPYVGRWNTLISTTNWEKGRIISEWRQQLIESGVDATQYSDEAWSRRVGGVTAPHVGRLRRVYDRFAETYQSYDALYWSHFLAALDWEDAPMWLEGAAAERWSISAMREKRWQAEGAVDGQRPTDSQIVEVETDEDVTLPAQGGGSDREYDNDSGDVAAGPSFEGPDFGDEEELQSLAGQADGGSGDSGAVEMDEAGSAAPVQPFIGLPNLPDDLSDAVEMLKLSVLRHKATDWRDVDVETVQKYLDAVGVMIRS
ncbi:hypothetical protein NHH03_14815 [Stieleria sp. TO1_6]|uniref:hypothetical protein n=1 Tax=Stieleria tagensis TaxID=2956795 RepID=UPI00209B2ECA|nr:hypothetical protein [Stieleria tagensis]MCO8123018.1 hypothetical protein [Stieleria tagensis]